MKPSSKLLQLFMIVVLIAGVLGLGLQQSASAKAPALGAWTQQWADEFNGSGAVSGSNWLYDLGHGYGCSSCGNWGTGEIENMTNSTANVNQTGGHLAITPIRDGAGNWSSGRIETQRTDFQPPAGGAMAIEASLQQPNVSGAAAAGYWPAFWALGAPFRGVYTNWPSVGELDIMEDINGLSSLFGTLHCGSSPGGPCNETTGIGSGQHACSGCQTGYHTYRFEYDKSVSPQQMRWYLDGAQYFTVTANQVDATTWANATNHGFFVILNVAIGGGFPAAFGGGPTAATVSGIPMNVDYVRVYYANGSGGGPTPTRTRTPTAGPAGGPAGYTFCANENGTCSFSGAASVAYGANGLFNYRTATNSIACNNATFGDPISGTVKACYYQLTTATNTPVPSGDFTRGVTRLSATQAQVWFTSNVNSAWVDVHYTGAPGLGQQNFRMARNGNTWTQTVSNLTTGTVLSYWFTYEKAGLAFDTAHFSYTH